MTEHADAVARVRAARRARDEAREQLYALELRRVDLTRASQREARGHAAPDPKLTRALAALGAEAGTLTAKVAELNTRLAALAELPKAAAELAKRASVAEQTAAEATREVLRLGEALEGREPDATVDKSVHERLKAAHVARATAHTRAESLRKERQEADAKVAAAKKEEPRLRADINAAESRIADVRNEMAAVRKEMQTSKLDPLVIGNREDIAAERSKLGRLEAAVIDAIAVLHGNREPWELIDAWDDALPILLLPLRVETRWKTENPDAPELWVRVYPDDVAVTTHEPVLTDAELLHGRTYWTQRRDAANDETRAAAWRALVSRFGANRSAWVARQTKPVNWQEALADSSLPLGFPVAALTKADSWTTAPHSRVLPDRFVLLGWRGNDLKLTVPGRPIDDVVILGPSPIENDGGAAITRDDVDRTLTLGESFAWVRDFDKAVQQGMAFRVKVDSAIVAAGFDELLVLGLKYSSDDADAKTLIEELIGNHHYARPGFALVPQGTPTNNTGASESGYSGAGRDGDDSAGEIGAPLFEPVRERAHARDGQRLADFLGIAYDPLLRVDGADLEDHAQAVAMNRALYAGTFGYYLDHMLNEVVDEKSLGEVRHHFTDFVTGRGPIAAIRVGPQPYGIIPTSALPLWSPMKVIIGREWVPEPFEQAMLTVLQVLGSRWEDWIPFLSKVGSPGEGAARLLDVLGLHATSEEFYQRVGYSYDMLKNMESLVSGWDEQADAIKLWFEAMGSWVLLRRLGYNEERPDGSSKPLPLLLQLVWRHYHTQLEARHLIDGQPLSETEGIKPYDEANDRNFVDWLIHNSVHAPALEAQDFGGAPRPSSLLYMLLHFSLVMEAGRGVHRFLAKRDVDAVELLRSRKFLNVGPQPTPSVWEIFRAPANRIVRGEASNRALLELVNSPQESGDAGQGIAEQRAALEVLRGMSTARLERALVEHIDTLSYRLDAWQTALVTRRLHRQRRLSDNPDGRRTGLYLGAFGYLRNVRAVPTGRIAVAEATLPEELRRGTENVFEQVGNGGYVHGPSLNHATAAALLRNGYLTHATPGDPNALAVNLSSARVRRARYLIDGVRNGQSLEVLLGVQFERELHDFTTRPTQPVILDQLKPVFRAKFPIKRTRVPQNVDADGGTGAATVTEDHQVVNGLELARAGAFPWGINELNALSNAQQAALEEAKDEIENTLDSLRDVLTAESAYQLALGNFDRAAGVVQSIGNGTIPPDVEVLQTPRGTALSFTNRLALHLSPAVAANPWAAVARTQRAQLEPALNNWLGTLLPDPEQIRCRVVALDPDDQSEISAGVVTLADMGVQPIDFIYMVRSQPEATSVAELEARIRYAFVRANDVPDAAVVRITFGDAGGAGARSFAEVLPLADRLRRLIGSARSLNARHFQSASGDAPEAPGNPGRIDVAELRTRVGDRIGEVKKLFRNAEVGPAVQPLESALADARADGALPNTVEALRSALKAIADAGFAYGMPVSGVGTSTAERESLVAQAESVLERFDALSVETTSRFLEVDTGGYAAERRLEILTDVVKGWMGGDFLLIPRFTFSDPEAVAEADAARDGLLSHARARGEPRPVDSWLHGVACVRPLVHGFEVARMMGEAAIPTPWPLAPLQLPFASGDHWLGVEFPDGIELLHDTVSVVQYLPQGFDATGLQSGLLIDEWVESIPNRTEVTGLTFNFNAPNAAPPQALLLAVTPEETGSWKWNHLVETVRDTFHRAQLRAVEPDRLGEISAIGTLLPAVIAEFSTSRASVSLDYTLTLAEIRGPAMAMMANVQLAPEG